MNFELLAWSLTLEAYNEAIVIVLTVQIVVTNIRVAEASTNGRLGSVPDKPAELAKAMDRTFAKIKASCAGFSDYVDVEVIEAVVHIEVAPLESNP